MMNINWGLFGLIIVFLLSPLAGLKSQGLFSSFEAGVGLSKTYIVDKDVGVLGTFNSKLDFSKQWQGDIHVTILETDKLEYDFGLSLTKSQLDYHIELLSSLDILAETITMVDGQQENWDFDISAGVLYKIVSDERNHLSVGPELIFRKTVVSVINESVASDTIVDPVIHDIFNKNEDPSNFQIGVSLKYAYMIKPFVGVYFRGYCKVPIAEDTIKYLGIDGIFGRLQTGITLGMKLRIRSDF